jgi:hypothetical protein
MDQGTPFRGGVGTKFNSAAGGIGPHVDSYDVFLVQTSGQRTWQVGHDKLTVLEMEALIPDLSVRILQQNDETPLTSTFTLNPGDVLPRYMHCGISDSDCMTLSVGCRAPSAGSSWHAQPKSRSIIRSSMCRSALYRQRCCWTSLSIRSPQQEEKVAGRTRAGCRRES